MRGLVMALATVGAVVALVELGDWAHSAPASSSASLAELRKLERWQTAQIWNQRGAVRAHVRAGHERAKRPLGKKLGAWWRFRFLGPQERRRMRAHERELGRLIRARERTRQRIEVASRPVIGWPWIAIADCESGGDSTPGRPPYNARWDYDGSSGFDGGVQFHPGTWTMAKVKPEVDQFAAGYSYAWQAPAWVQVAVAANWLRYTSWSQWPACSSLLGLR